MISLTKNYRLEDLLLKEATKAENSGDHKLAEKKLSDALKPHTTKQSKPKIRNDICAETVSLGLFRTPFFSEYWKSQGMVLQEDLY